MEENTKEEKKSFFVLPFRVAPPAEEGSSLEQSVELGWEEKKEDGINDAGNLIDTRRKKDPSFSSFLC